MASGQRVFDGVIELVKKHKAQKVSSRLVISYPRYYLPMWFSTSKTYEHIHCSGITANSYDGQDTEQAIRLVARRCCSQDLRDISQATLRT